MDLEVRPCLEGELDQVLELWASAAEEPTPTDDVEGISNLMIRDASAFLVAVMDGAIVGTIIAGWDGWRGNLYRLAVRPGYRRQGVARALVKTAEGHLHEKGARRLHAGILQHYGGATAFWQSAGYCLDDRIARHAKTLG